MEDYILKVEQVSKCFELNKKKQLLLKDAVKESLRSIFKPKQEEKELFWALKDVSFELRPGESLGIIGKNGVGKSTLLKILAGVTYPSSGSIHIRGKVASILEIGSGFHPELTGRENVYFNGQILGFSKKEIDKRFQQIVDFSEIEAFIDTPVKYYSSGMFLRLAFSLVIHFDQEIMLFDEVMAVGDAAFQLKCNDKILELRNRKRTFILVSHNAREVDALCDKVLLLENGEVKLFGDSYEVQKMYMNSMQVVEEEPEEEEPEELQEDGSETDADQDLISLKKIEAFVGNEVRETFKQGEAFRLEVSYDLRNDDPSIDVGLAVMDMFQTRLFAEHTIQMNPNSKNKKGSYKLTWEIPENILNIGSFVLELIILREHKIIGRIGNAFNFEISGNREVVGEMNVYLPIRFKPSLKIESIGK